MMMSTNPVPQHVSARGIFKHTRRAEHRAEVTALLEQTMDPISAQLVRMVLPGDVTTLGTALARTSSQSTVEWYSNGSDGWVQPSLYSSGGSQTPLMNSPGSFYATLLRDPVVRAITRSDMKEGAAQPSYELEFGFPYDRLNSIFVLQRTTPLPIPVSGMVHVEGTPVYGEWVPGGVHEGRRVIWLDASPDSGTIITLQLSVENDSEDAKDRLRFTVFNEHPQGRTVDFSQLLLQSADLANGYGRAITITASGYYSFEIELLDKVDDTYAPQISAFSMFYDSESLISFCRHHPTAGLTNKKDTVVNGRTLGASMLLSNVAPVVKRGGSVTLAQTSAVVPWYQYWSNDERLDTVNVQARDVLNWENGAYTYIKPQGSNPFQMHSIFECNDCLNTKLHRPLPMFEPFGDHGQVVIRIDPPIESIESETANLRIVLATALEFTTDDQFYNVVVSQLSSEDHDEFVAALRLMPQFYDNPIHLAAIASLIRAAASTVVEWGPRIRTGIRHAERVAGYIAR